jgi:regulator of sigma E protease
MELIETIFFTLIALGVLVTFHEFGHFWVARRCGVKVERFSIGFGKPLATWRDKQDTEFVVAILPLGGYVKMLDERDVDVSAQDLPYAFNRKTVWQRMAIVSAGPIANFLLAFLFYWLIFLAGERALAPIIGDVKVNSLASNAGLESGMEIVAVNNVATSSLTSVSRQLFNFIGTSGEIPITVIYPDSELRYEIYVPIEAWLEDAENPMPLKELGISPPFELESLKLATVFEDSAGYVAGLREDDQLLAINGRPITHVEGFIDTIAGSAGTRLSIELQRPQQDGTWQTMTVQAIPDRVQQEGRTVGQLGVQLASSGRYPEELVRTEEYTVLGALVRGLEETYDNTVFVLSSLGKLLVGELSAKNLSGPITIAKVAGDSARAGLDNFIRFVAILSIMLGVMNLLPIPVLDGGHLMYAVIELVKGSPVSEQVQMLGYKLGFVMLVGLMVFATFNDLMRPF